MVFKSQQILCCPFCGYTADRFLSYGDTSPIFDQRHIVGGGFRQNAVCPKCKSIDRERLVFLFLLTHYEANPTDLRVLHVAPEHCLGTWLKLNTRHYLDVDVLPERATVQADIRALPFATSYFDLVVCNHVLEHIDNDLQAMKELHRVLVPGGRAVLQVPICPSLEVTLEDQSIKSQADRKAAFGQSDHVRLYGQDYGARLAVAGFAVPENIFDSVQPMSWSRHAVIHDEVVFDISKP